MSLALELELEQGRVGGRGDIDASGVFGVLHAGGVPESADVVRRATVHVVQVSGSTPLAEFICAGFRNFNDQGPNRAAAAREEEVLAGV